MKDSPPGEIRSSSWVLRLSVALLGVIVLVPIWSVSWPPAWMDRRNQRKRVLERIQSAGGWAALQRDCDNLMEQYRESVFVWSWGSTNPLPPAIAALKPQELRFDSPALWRNY